MAKILLKVDQYDPSSVGNLRGSLDEIATADEVWTLATNGRDVVVRCVKHRGPTPARLVFLGPDARQLAVIGGER